MILGALAQLVEGEEGKGDAEKSPGQDVTRVVLVVSHPGDGHQHRVQQHQHLNK